MLAAENPSVDGHLAASTPRRRGMDCKSSNNANKKLIQARLPFKRLNPEPKENQPPKRPCAHACPEPGVSDNENESSALPVHSGPPLVNGRGPLDGFLSRRHPTPSDESMVIDLTASSPTKRLVTPPASPCLPTKNNHTGKDKTVSSGKSSNVDHTPKAQVSDCTVTKEEEEEEEEEEEKDGNQTASISQLDTTQDSESEPEEEENESENVSSLGNRSMLSASSVSSSSESSPEKSKSDDPTPTTPTEPKTTPKITADQKIKRRSLKSLQEQEERLRLRQEKERQKEEAKAAKEKKREEARKQKEEREREKREKKEKDEREKREKKEKEEKEKAERLKAKEEQRKSKLEAKLEEKRKKEEEKRMKEEEKRLKEEKDRLKAEKAEITRFLQKPKIQQAPKTLAAACGKFAPFEIKENVFLAPLCRVQCDDSVLEELDRCLLDPAENLNGLKEWIGQKPRHSGPTKPRQISECVTVEGPKPDSVPDRKRYGPMKLLQFHANYRPAYWGSWSKKSSHISPRCPLRRDKDLLDYEVDSDEEWEEEEPGESLSHSEGEDEEEGGEDDDDDGFFVPHGYLSDDEGALEEEEGGDLEKQKLRQKLKAREWDELMSTKKKMKVLEPVVRGCVWEGEGPGLQVFQPYAVCLVEPLPKADTSPSPEELSQRVQREAQLLSQLLALLHGNLNSSKVIINEFQEFCRQQTSSSSPAELSSPQSPAENIPTRIQVRRLIKNNAVYEKRSTYRRCCWYVHTEVLSRFGQEALPVPCQWTYLTTGAREESREEPQAATGSQGNSPTTPQTSSTSSTSSNKRKSTGSMSITKFMKRCTDPEQTEAMEADGFQADTEDDDEEDCVIISTQSDATTGKSPSEEDGLMEVTPSDTAALPVASAAPTLATA
ncbi:chromatin assembly factor 1 subunit A [Enoplosus armatus]|uniref:chromatin assembly factor 1 subunit A n=1 Tax=Enoplosus armatus TaxID=215367 RepID=UPI003994A603